MRITEQAKQQTRARILDKAAEIFVGKGFDDTTTRDMAEAAGVAVGTLFNYFPSKETLAMTMVAEALSRGKEDFQSRRSGNESLVEELHLLVASGLRRLRPLRSFVGPVLERSLSSFPRKSVCSEGEAARQEHLTSVREVMARHGFTAAPEDVAVAIYWSLYLGMLAFWLNDESPKQEASQAFIDYSLRIYVNVVSGELAGSVGEDHAD